MEHLIPNPRFRPPHPALPPLTPLLFLCPWAWQPKRLRQWLFYQSGSLGVPPGTHDKQVM